MKLKCPKCKKVFERDMRNKYSRSHMTKDGYKSYCEKIGRNTLSQPIH